MSDFLGEFDDEKEAKKLFDSEYPSRFFFKWNLPGFWRFGKGHFSHFFYGFR